MKPSYFYLTCPSLKEAKTIGDALLQQRFVACVKYSPVTSAYHWQGNIERSEEILMTMESAEAFFDRAEAKVKELHSYKTFVLTAVPMVRISAGAHAWLQNELGLK